MFGLKIPGSLDALLGRVASGVMSPRVLVMFGVLVVGCGHVGNPLWVVQGVWATPCGLSTAWHVHAVVLRGGGVCAFLAHGVAGEGEVVRVVDDAVEDRVGEGWFADRVVPGGGW